MTQSGEIAVIGAGIVGIAAASWLQRGGHRVVVIDPDLPGRGASWGNAGCFSPSSIVPLSGPGMLRQVPRWLLDPAGPLALRWRYLPRAMPWLLRFVRAGGQAAVEHQAAALARLLAPVHDCLEPLLAEAGAADLVQRKGSLIVYRTKQAWVAAQAGWSLRRRNGIGWEELGPDGLRGLDAALTPNLHCGVLLPGNGHTTDPHSLVTSLAEAFVRRGGRLVAARATGFDLDGGRLRAVQTEAGPIAAGAAVLAAGAYSRPLARALGDRLPLETERGYHLTIQRPEVMPRYPTLAAEGRFVATPMAGGLRLTGTVELAGLQALPDWARARALLPLAQALYPGLANDGGGGRTSVWMGHRPSMPDSLPVIGRSRRTDDVIYAFGHGHLGLTGAPATARIVSELVDGRPPFIDPAAYSPARFRRG